MQTDGNMRPATKFFDHYPPRWWAPIVNIYGSPHQNEKGVYMTRVHLSPKTRWGQLYLHIFHRADGDRDFHDHPFDFYTFPLNQGYIEDVLKTKEQCHELWRVPPRRWTYRPATHCHRVVKTDSGQWPLVTLVWRCATARKWGFWVRYNPTASDALLAPEYKSILFAHRFWVPWQRYVSDEGAQIANRPGDDVTCPGYQQESLNNDGAR